jgi:hypothetical protein
VSGPGGVLPALRPVRPSLPAGPPQPWSATVLLAELRARGQAALRPGVPPGVPQVLGRSPAPLRAAPAVSEDSRLEQVHPLLAEAGLVPHGSAGEEAGAGVLPAPSRADPGQTPSSACGTESIARVVFSLKGRTHGARGPMATGSAHDGRLARRGGQGSGGDRPERRAGTRAGWDGASARKPGPLLPRQKGAGR